MDALTNALTAGHPARALNLPLLVPFFVPGAITIDTDILFGWISDRQSLTLSLRQQGHCSEYYRGCCSLLSSRGQCQQLSWQEGWCIQPSLSREPPLARLIQEQQMKRTSSFNTSNGNIPLMKHCGIIGIFLLVVALLDSSGCTQPTVQVPVNPGLNSTPVTFVTPSPVLTGSTGIVTAQVTIRTITGPAGQAPSPTPSAGNPQPGGFVRYTGPAYSIDYPAAWSSNSTVLPLREYHHLDPHDCSVTFAYNLNEELRMYYSSNGGTLFYTEIVNTDRDIWPMSLSGGIAYEDIVNAILGNPESCANLEGNEAFTIAGISQVPLDGVSYTGVRVDFARINLTGFAVGKGTAYVVTGKNYRGVFTFYGTSPATETQANLAQYMFDSLRLDSGF